MSDKETGGPAFPCTEANYTDPRWTAEGLSIRDYFAAKAMQSILTHGTNSSLEGDLIDAKVAYRMADAMIKARAS